MAEGTLRISDALERSQWSSDWLPADVKLIDRPELLCRTCPRDNPTLNSVVRVRAPRARFEALVHEVALAHSGVRSRWQVPHTPAYEALPALLERLGHARVAVHDALGLPLSSSPPRRGSGAVVSRVCSPTALAEANRVADAAFGTQVERTQESLAKNLRDCQKMEGRTHRFVARVDGRAISVGALTIHQELGLGFLWGGATLAEFRGHGHYTAVVNARHAFARARGLDFLGVYAREDTSSPVLRSQGFSRAGRMSYWQREPAAPPHPEANSSESSA